VKTKKCETFIFRLIHGALIAVSRLVVSNIAPCKCAGADGKSLPLLLLPLDELSSIHALIDDFKEL
jgi:hypothetical protein